MEQQLLRSESAHEDFRLWITAEPHPSFPIGLLHMGLKLTNEAPVGIKAGLRASFQWLSQASQPFWSRGRGPEKSDCRSWLFKEGMQRILTMACAFYPEVLAVRKGGGGGGGAMCSRVRQEGDEKRHGGSAVRTA